MAVTVQTSRVNEVINALYTNLSARPGLADVLLFRYAPSERVTARPVAWLTIAQRINGEQEYTHLTRAFRDDRITFAGEIQVRVPNDYGATPDEVAGLAHTRVEAIFAELEAELRVDHRMGLGNLLSEVAVSYQHIYGGNDTERAHRLEFDISVTARMTMTS